jgi:hypothetical protein
MNNIQYAFIAKKFCKIYFDVTCLTVFDIGSQKAENG